MRNAINPGVDYFDTSTLLPYYRLEPLSGTVQNLLLAVENSIAISSLVDVEIASALARLVRMGEFRKMLPVEKRPHLPDRSAFRASLPTASTPSVELIRTGRDEERY